jgi:predicted ATP-grasp superfamily ATP-dependent carboligase
MRRAIAGDFAALDGGRSRVAVTLDARFGDDPGPWTVERVSEREQPGRIGELARGADYTVLIAPETMGILAGMTRELHRCGARVLGSSPAAVALAADKARLAEWLATRGINTPPCRIVTPRRGLPPDADYPAVLKPRDGAGTIHTYFVEDHRHVPGLALDMDDAILQPYAAGQAMSASFLVDASGRAWLIGIGTQHVTLKGGRFEYRGGRLPVAALMVERRIRAAVESVPGLRGFAGVDFIWDERRLHATVLEINPRPTTSLVGLARLLPPGRLAAAWIGAFEPGSAGELLLPDLGEIIRAQAPVSFDASGNVFAPGDEG